MAFSFKRSITIDKTKVPNTNRADFPVLISGTYTYLKTTGNGGDVQNANGYDINFFSDSALTTLLDWETERYIATTGEVIYWVKVPTVSTSVDTVIYMAYGDSGITTDQSDAVNVWDGNYKGVYHLPDGSSLTANDSTTNANNGTVTNATAATGQIGGGANFDGSGDYIDMGNNSSLDGGGNITMSAWIDVNNFPSGTIGPIIHKDGSGFDACYELRLNDNSGPVLEAGSYDGSDHFVTWSITGWSTGVKKMIHGRWDGTNWEVFLDGLSKASSATGTGTVTGTGTLWVGKSYGSRYLDAILDDIRISMTARSDDRILTEFNKQSSPSTFYAVSSPLSSGTTVNPGTGVITYTGIAPTVVASNHQNVAPGTGVVTFTGFSPSVVATDHKNVSPGAGAVTFTGFAPVVFASNLINVSPGSGVVTYTGISPVVNITISVLPGAGEILYTGFAPTVSGGGSVNISTGTGIILFEGFAPAINLSVSASPGTGIITYTGYAPIVSISDHINIQTSTGVVLYTGYSPIASVSNNQSVSPGTGIIVFVGYAPTFSTAVVVV